MRNETDSPASLQSYIRVRDASVCDSIEAEWVIAFASSVLGCLSLPRFTGNLHLPIPTSTKERPARHLRGGGFLPSPAGFTQPSSVRGAAWPGGSAPFYSPTATYPPALRRSSTRPLRSGHIEIGRFASGLRFALRFQGRRTSRVFGHVWIGKIARWAFTMTCPTSRSL